MYNLTSTITVKSTHLPRTSSASIARRLPPKTRRQFDQICSPPIHPIIISKHERPNPPLSPPTRLHPPLHPPHPLTQAPPLPSPLPPCLHHPPRTAAHPPRKTRQIQSPIPWQTTQSLTAPPLRPSPHGGAKDRTSNEEISTHDAPTRDVYVLVLDE